MLPFLQKKVLFRVYRNLVLLEPPWWPTWKPLCNMKIVFSRCYGYRLPFKYCKLSRKVLQKQNEFWTSTYAAVYLFCYHHFPYFFRLLFGNIRQVSALKNTLKEAGITDTTFIADKGFYTENNINVLEDKDLNTSSR